MEATCVRVIKTSREKDGYDANQRRQLASPIRQMRQRHKHATLKRYLDVVHHREARMRGTLVRSCSKATMDTRKAHLNNTTCTGLGIQDNEADTEDN